MTWTTTVLLLLSILLIPWLVSCSDYPLHIFIDPLIGNDTDQCLDSNSSSTPCKTLSFVAENLTSKYLVQIEIQREIMTLEKSADFVKYTNLTLNGRRNATINCTQPNVGLAFTLIDNLTLHSIRIEKCGLLQASTSLSHNVPQETLSLSVAVYILNCTNVAITSVDILWSNGTGLSIYDTTGTMSIQKCTFRKNLVEVSQQGGGGLHIEFTICTPGWTTNCSDHNRRNSNSHFFIKNCSFLENIANSPFDKHQFISPKYSTLIPRTGKGGGIYISIGSDATNNSISITNTLFHRNGAVFNSGGMLVELLNSATNNSVVVSEVTFKDNSCGNPRLKYCVGGGLIVAFIFYEESRVSGPPRGNSFVCNFCTFGENVAFVGGGTGILVTKQRNSDHMSNITFSNSQWENNSAPVGAAVDASPDTWDYETQGVLPSPLFKNCSFSNNSAFYLYSQNQYGLNISSPGYGAVFSTEVKLIFKGRTSFKNNKGSGLYLPNSIIKFGEGTNATFVGNVGHNGGAIAMYGHSLMQIHNNSVFLFSENQASSMGGAIYSDVTVAFQPTCFIQPSKAAGMKYKTNSMLHFQNNHAGFSGKAIYTTSFHSCKILCQHNTTSPQSILNCIADFVFDDNSTPPLATQPDHYELNSPVYIRPGSEYHLLLAATDEANNTPSGIVYQASMDQHSNIHLDQAFTQVSNNTIKLHGSTGDSGKLHLSNFENILSLNVTLVDCQPGYLLDPSEGACKCRAPDYFGLVPTCGPTVYLKDGYWMGHCSENGKMLCTTYCPYGFCSYHQMDPKANVHPLPTNSAKLETMTCGPNRRGAVCSLCADGHTVYFHSWRYKCGREELCHYGWLLYFLTEFLPLIVFYIIILYFNVSFTHGNLHCFVFFAQVLSALNINANGSVKYKYITDILHDISFFIYGPLNLNFFTLEPLSFCLWEGATVIHMMVMKCVTVVLAFLLVFLTILLTRCRVTNRLLQYYTPNSILIHGISTFVIICYSQIAYVTFHILTYFCLYSTNYHCEERVVNYMGYMVYFHGDHLKYAIPAVFVAIFFIVLPPLMLLIYPLLFKLLGLCNLSESGIAVTLSRLMPIQLLDSFQGSFKDNFRFFSGLYFLYRAIILCAYAYCSTLLQFYAVIQLQLLLMIALHSLVQPYKERKHNITDALLFTNLAIINGITIYAFAQKDFRDKEASKLGLDIIGFVQVLLIFLPFLCVVIIGVIEWRKRRRNLDGTGELPSLRRSEESPLLTDWASIAGV